MSLTNTEKLLARGLMLFKLDKETFESIFALLEEEEQQWEMIEYMMGHENATEQDLIGETIRILKMNPTNT